MGKHKFDHNEARRLHFEEGATLAEIARRFGVTTSPVRYACYPESRTVYACVDCGAACGWSASQPRCLKCATAVRTTTVREDELQCYVCKQWKPDEAFHRNKRRPHRRGRDSRCRTCRPVDSAIERAIQDHAPS